MYKGEWFNAISHLIGAALALIGLVLLVVMAARQGDPWKIVSFSIYGTTLVVLYTSSTLYHSVSGKTKTIFRKFDHFSIYLLIAGTYTPFTLVTLRGAWGWSIFVAIWGLAVFGIVLEALPQKRKATLSVAIYIFMGWLILIALEPLLASLPLPGFAGLFIGGIFYTVGVVFFALDKRVRHFHGIWHLFVLAGSISHYIAVLVYVL